MRWARATPAAVFLAALAVRLAHLQQVAAHDPFYDQPSVDSLVYVEWAKRLAAGHWLGDEAFFLSPLYGYFLGALYALAGSGPLWPLVANALFGAGTCLVTYTLACRLFDRRIGLAAAALACFYRMEIFYEGAPLVEALQTLLCALSVWGAVRALERPGAGRFALAGALLGLAVLARQNLLLFALPFAAWAWLALRGRESARRRLLLPAAYLGALALAIAPATLANWLAARDFVLVNSTGGIVLYTGWNPEANGVYMVPSLFPRALADDPVEQKNAYRALAEARLGRSGLRASEVSSYWRGQALDWVAANPGPALALGLEKARLFWNAFEAWDVRSVTLARPSSWVLRLPLVSFAWLGPLALAGIALSARRWRTLVPLYLALAVHFGTAVLFIALSRYRVPALSVLAVFGGVTPIALFDALRERRARLAAAAGAALAAAAFAVNFRVPAEDLSMAHFNLGNVYKERGQWDAAVEEYFASLETAPAYISTWNNLALVYERSGAAPELQARVWQRVLQLARAQGSALHVERATRHLAALQAAAPEQAAPRSE
ncbi:MAG TPA: glycosyltransferase family 39 protein [Myxococcota bacterium]|nr:glycosyltransferase family 39 protein [Myxococcota bacterium]